MIEAKPYPKEQERIAALKSLHLLDAPIEERFERITRMVCKFLDVPIALFNLLDVDRQHYKSARGLTNTDAPLPGAFCTHAIHEDNMLLIPNARIDQRFHDNPFVTGGLKVGFYAGCPIHTPNGMPVGTLCAIDHKPRNMTDDQLALLRDLAAIVETELRVSSLSAAQQQLMGELQEARHMALVDPLTRLWNRAGIEKLLEREWAEAERQSKPVTLVMGDIDHFKKINDTFGHPAGDNVLRNVAKRLLETTRAADDVGRVGGEEFLMILTNNEATKVMETVERVRLRMERDPMMIGELQQGNAKIIQNYPVTMSFGAATALPGGSVNSAALIKRADEALYRAKNGGRNRVVVA